MFTPQTVDKMVSLGFIAAKINKPSNFEMGVSWPTGNVCHIKYAGVPMIVYINLGFKEASSEKGKHLSTPETQQYSEDAYKTVLMVLTICCIHMHIFMTVHTLALQ